jgi:hypothetical protein
MNIQASASSSRTRHRKHKKFKFKYELYHHLFETQEEFLEKAKKIPAEVGLPSELRGQIGLTGTISENHGLLRREIIDAIAVGARKVTNNATLDKEVRRLVKDWYGDEYDAVATNTCEALLNVSFDTLASPPIAGRGQPYTARYIAPYEKHLHHQGAYGRPFPPKYKDYAADRGLAAGEFGQIGKRLTNLEAVLVPLEGAKYDCHGIKYHPCTLLSGVDAEKSADRIAQVAREQVASLAAITSLGYTHPGYGYGQKDEKGVPILQKRLAEIAQSHNVPYILDNAVGVPFICTDPRDIGCDVMLFSMDKASGGPTCGLAIGKEATIVPMARAMGIHSHRNGSPAAHGKASHVAMDPGKEALTGLIALLRLLQTEGDKYRKQIDIWHEIVEDEFSRMDSGLRKGLSFDKDYNGLCSEVDYEKTWSADRFGIPIFSVEDLYSGTALTMAGMRAMGIAPCIMYDGTLKMSPGLGTTDEHGELIVERVRPMIRCMVRMLEVLCQHSGVMD